MDLEHPDALITFHPQQVTVVRDDRFGTRVDGAFDDTIVVWIAGHYIKSDLRHEPHSAFADVFLLPRKRIPSGTTVLHGLLARGRPGPVRFPDGR